MDASSYYKVTRRPDGVIHLEAFAGEFAYIVEGKEKALLIDTGTGFGNIREVCEKLTKLPLIVANTHGHMDHAGGNTYFDEVYLHPNDLHMVGGPINVQGMINFAKGQRGEGAVANLDMNDIPVERPVTYHPIREGDVFDLGGRTLEVIEVPGHTKGSVAFFDRENGLFFAGDSCNNNTLLFFDHSTTVEEYSHTLAKMKKLQPEIRTFYISHGYCPVDKKVIDEAIECCEKIMAGTDDKVPFGPAHVFASNKAEHYERLDGKFAIVVYKDDRIFEPKK